MEKRTKIPEWATHVASDQDGSMWVFSGEPRIFSIPTGKAEDETIEVWEPIDDRESYKFIGNSEPDLFWRESVVTIDEFKRMHK